MEKPFRVKPAGCIAGEQGYGIPRPSAPVNLWLNGNEGSAPDAGLLEALVESGPEILRRYPKSGELEALLAGRHGVGPENVIVTAGADEALDRICRAVLEPGRELVVPVPTFEMFELCTRLSGGTMVEVPWYEGPCPVEEILAKVGQRTAAVGIVTPNNPTGLVATPEDLERLSAGAEQALLIVDLAYSEFAEVDLMPTVLSLPNAAALRTLSKAWGLAGLRVGYAVGPEPLIRWLRNVGGPYPVAQISRQLARRRVQTGEGDVRTFVDCIRKERRDLFGLLDELGANPLPSQGNFVFARPGDAVALASGLEGMGIAVRAFPGRKHLDDALRITCPGDPADFQRLEHALRTVVEPEALLLDMDGVLADVSGSYRQAIVQTAACFGVEVTAADITRANAAGNSNNDWELTRRLVAGKGVEVGLEEVTARFEEVYQGTQERPGLRETETLLCPVEVLQELAEQLPLAVVTGRPRGDTMRFLESQDIGELFQELVCMEDGPLKPDPAPVRLALERLGVRRAWFVGDTPDDVRAARGAGVLPVGIVGPADRDGGMERALREAGAGWVMGGLGDLVKEQRGRIRQTRERGRTERGTQP